MEPFLGAFQACRVVFLLFRDKTFHKEPAEYICEVSSLAKKRSALIRNLPFYVLYMYEVSVLMETVKK